MYCFSVNPYTFWKSLCLRKRPPLARYFKIFFAIHGGSPRLRKVIESAVLGSKEASITSRFSYWYFLELTSFCCSFSFSDAMKMAYSSSNFWLSSIFATSLGGMNHEAVPTKIIKAARIMIPCRSVREK